jgi:hypothetical protein
MGKLITLNQIKDDELIDKILNSEITVFEDIQGSKIFVNWNGQEFQIKAKSISNDPLNLIDLTLQNYYNKAINYFLSFSDRVKGLMDKKWWFCFEFFPDSQPANIEYNRIPKNNLVLTSICKNGKFNYTPEELDEYSRLFEVDVIPYIFKGTLNSHSKEAIKYFLNTSEGDLEYVFGEKSFAYFFYKLLNPQLKNSFLMEDDFQRNLEKIVINVDGLDVSFEILNPLYTRFSESNSTDFVEIYSLILINFLNFCVSINMNEIKLKGSKREEIYIYLICKIFNIYLTEVKEDLMNFDFVVPQFFDKDKFRINTELIPNKMTKEIISENKKFEYIFKVILGSFNKKRKKPVGLFTDATLVIFNTFVDKIQSKIDEFYKRKGEAELMRTGLVDFSQWFDVKYDVDSEGQVYPDVYNEIESESEESKKKKGKLGGVPDKGKDMKTGI